MSYKPLMSGEQMFDIKPQRYDELIRAEHRLTMLENALEDMNGYVDIDQLKKLFGIGNGIRED